MKRVLFCAVSICLLIFTYTTASIADGFTFRLSANQDSLDSEFEAIIDHIDNTIITGINGLYESDDYKLLFLKLMLSGETVVDGLDGGLGFKGTWGEGEKSYIKGDILNIGFAGTLSYDLSKSDLNSFPVTLTSSLFFSPQPLCFADGKNMFEFTAEGSWKILEQASVVVSFRYLEVEFDHRVKWKKSDSSGYLGLKFLF